MIGLEEYLSLLFADTPSVAVPTPSAVLHRYILYLTTEKACSQAYSHKTN